MLELFLHVVMRERTGVIRPEFQVGYEGSTLHILCSSMSLPVWIRDGMPARGHVTEHFLKIEKVTQEDNGLYMCEGTNLDGTTFTAMSKLYVGG